MKHILLPICTLLVCASVNAAVIWQTGFESGEGYSLGTINGQQDWSLYYLTGSRSTGMVTSTVSGGSVPEGSQCLWLGPGTAAWSAVIHPIDLSGTDLEANYVSIALKAWPDADYCEMRPMDIGTGYSNIVMRFLAFGGNLWISADENNDGANEWFISGSPGASYLQWHDWKVVLDINAKKIVRIEADTNVWEFNNVFFYNNGAGQVASTVNRIRLSNSGVNGSSGRRENYFDAIKVATETKPAKPPGIFATPESLTFNNADTTRIVTVLNTGTGSFSYTVSSLPAAPWISFSPTAGTVNVSVSLNVIVDHNVVTDGFYRTLALIDAGPAGVATVTVAMANGKVLYETDFSEPYFRVDQSLLGQDGWSRVGNQNEAVVTNLPDSEGPCAVITKSYGSWWDERFYKPLDPADTENQIVKYSCRVRVPSDLVDLAGVMDQRYWDPSKVVLLFRPNEDGTVHITEGYDDPPDGQRPAVDTWFDIAYTMDLALDKLTYMKFGPYEASDLSIDLKAPVGTLYHYVNRISFYVAGHELLIENGLAFDNVRVELLDRPAEPELAVSGSGWFYPAAAENNVIVELVNSGEGSISYTSTVVEGASWLSIPDAGGIITNIPKQVTAIINRSAIGDDYVYGKIAVDGGAAGTVYAIIAVGNGSVYYATDFSETFYKINQNLVGQDKWRTDGSSVAAVTNYMSSDGACACVSFMDGVWWNLQRFHRDINTIPENGRIKCSCRFFVPATANEAFFGDGVVYDWGNTKGKLQFVVDSGKVDANDLCFNSFTIPVDQRPAVGEWFEAVYVLDLAANLVTYVKVGEYEVKGINLPLPDNNSSKITEFSFGDRKHLEAFNSLIAIDDIRVETYIPQNPPTCMVYPEYLALGPSQNSGIMFVLNDGTGSYAYTATKLDDAGWLTVSPASGVVSSSAVQLNAQVNRSGLADGYYRSRVLIDGGAAGVVTSMVCMGQGAVVYLTDFSNTWYSVGNINGQDGWAVNDPSFVAASVVDVGGAQGLCGQIDQMTNWTWEGIAHPAPVDAESIVKVSGRFLVPSTAAGFQLVTRSNEKFAARFFMGQDNMVHLDVNDLTDVVEPVDPDAWFDFSITIDLDAQVDAVQEIVFGSDRIDNPGIFLYNIDQHQFDSIALLATGDWSIPDNQQGIRFDDISVEIIPEPGTVLLLLSCMLFGLRRRF